LIIHYSFVAILIFSEDCPPLILSSRSRSKTPIPRSRKQSIFNTSRSL